ncbi:ABC transporter ATP-binding protein [Clostridium carboxidivorans P7]|uniref:ABC transporter related protein n=1 Tax=Clostridium carboxidivorans P7 TaxID=536227 RepID=C6PX20_9CLOT|nr:ATP-binding cassette domain-containing protein [Clostridium carboxidivorans]AKN31159.1 ABC transporter ATP-binding protein [Clostridium carboxidivorans P7]EET86197.1 ABC transporter related protein [Clostridium carboxidivorans P7]EFG88268.1 ABC transporter, ATP-binding protein [Clostridium carboxidivorans P7]
MEIHMSNLCMVYKTGKEALKNVNLQLKSPSLIGLVGPNGAGKSTLMKILVTRLLQTSGTVTVDGQKLYGNEKYIKNKLGYLPQDFGLYDELTVYNFLDYIAALKGLEGDKKNIIENIILDTNLMDKRNSKISTLSGGQKQRVGIAQAMLGNPELLILDEPTVGLDPEERINFRNMFSKASSNKIVILSTHIIDDVESICNRLIVIDKGTILFDGTPEKLIKNAEGHVATCIGESMADILVEKNFKITSRISTAKGLNYRIVGEVLPDGINLVSPSLEDAYMFLMLKEEVKA